jgi:CheY-like chemotaxis protein
VRVGRFTTTDQETRRGSELDSRITNRELSKIRRGADMETRDAVVRSALIFDDQPEVREYLAAMTAGPALNVILCDLRIPDSDGVETRRALATVGVTSSFM